MFERLWLQKKEHMKRQNHTYDIYLCKCHNEISLNMAHEICQTRRQNTIYARRHVRKYCQGHIICIYTITFNWHQPTTCQITCQSICQDKWQSSYVSQYVSGYMSNYRSKILHVRVFVRFLGRMRNNYVGCRVYVRRAYVTIHVRMNVGLYIWHHFHRIYLFWCASGEVKKLQDC